MTLTRDDLQAIAQIVDERMDKKLDEKLVPIIQRLDCLEEKVDRLDERVSRLEEKVDELQTEMIYVKKRVGHLEHMVMSEVIPRLTAIESCYVATFDRYRYYADKMEKVIEDVERLKRVASDHSRRLQRIESVC